MADVPAKAKKNGPKRSAVRVREATPKDIAALVALNRAAYPSMAENHAVWGESHLISHQRIFSQGQLVAEVGGKVVGAAASLIVNMGPDPLRQHTWAGITDSGYFYGHDPNGDTLYGADVYVHPDAAGPRRRRRLVRGPPPALPPAESAPHPRRRSASRLPRARRPDDARGICTARGRRRVT